MPHVRLFSIKGKPSCKDDARHLLRSIQLSRYLLVEHKLIVDLVIQRNAYFFYPENLILFMITERVSIYASAVQPAARGPHAARRLISCGPPVLAKFVRNNI